MRGMPSPACGDGSQRPGNLASADVEPARSVQEARQQRRPVAFQQRVLPLPAAHDPYREPDDLVTRALAILQREQERWQTSRSEDPRQGGRS